MPEVMSNLGRMWYLRNFKQISVKNSFKNNFCSLVNWNIVPLSKLCISFFSQFPPRNQRMCQIRNMQNTSNTERRNRSISQNTVHHHISPADNLHALLWTGFYKSATYQVVEETSCKRGHVWGTGCVKVEGFVPYLLFIGSNICFLCLVLLIFLFLFCIDLLQMKTFIWGMSLGLSWIMFLETHASLRGGGGGVVGIARFRKFLPIFHITRGFGNKESRIVFDPRSVDFHQLLLYISIRQTIFPSNIIDFIFMVFNQKTQHKILLGLISIKKGSEGLWVWNRGGFREFRKVEPLGLKLGYKSW